MSQFFRAKNGIGPGPTTDNVRPVIFMLLAPLVLAAGCTSKSLDAQKAPSASPFDVSMIPPATGDGNFELCLTNDAGENGITKVNLPGNILFQSWGTLVKPLRERQNNDLAAISGDRTDAVKEMTSYALVTDRAVTLSSAQPCVITTAHMVTSEGFNWPNQSIMASKHYVFAPQPMMLKDLKLTNIYWGESITGKPNGKSRGGVAGDAIANEYFTGIPLKDIGEPVALDDSD